MSPSSSPTVRRRRLAAELHRLRGNRTGSEVAKAVGWSTSKISRAESGRESLPPTEIEKLLDYYGVEGRLREGLLGLAEDATRRGWWEDYADALNSDYLEFIGLETEATSSLQWNPEVVPGLLQTTEYARYLSKAFQTIVPTTPPATQERFLQARTLRQQRLTQEPVLRLSVVLDEVVLLRGVGDRGVMRDQLTRLVDVAELPNVDLRILPLNQEVALGGTASFVIMSFGLPEDPVTASLGDVVSTENLTTRLYVEGEADTHLYRLFFQGLANAALPPAESRKFIKDIRKRAWS